MVLLQRLAGAAIIVVAVGCGPKTTASPGVHADTQVAIVDADVAGEAGQSDSSSDLYAGSDTQADVEVADVDSAGIDAETDADGAGPDTGETGPPVDVAVQPKCATTADCKPSACQDTLCLAGKCEHSDKPDGAKCPILDPCAAGGVCMAGDCTATGQKPCDDSNTCTSDGCDAKTGDCLHEVKLAAPCEDGNPCTKGDVCGANGSCGAGLNICTGCATLKDCAAYDDGNLCNGVLYCNTAKSPSACEIYPQSTVVCDSSADTACAHAACAPATGQCAVKATAEGSACDDGNPCTQGDKCNAGKCAFAANVCQCENNGDCGTWNDTNACNGTLYCDTSAEPYSCKINPNSLVTCPAGSDPCVTSVCDPQSGKCGVKPAADGIACSDGSAKTVGDVCVGGKCQPGTDTAVCKIDVDCWAQEDGDLCNGTMFCNKATGMCQVNPKTAVKCPSVDDSACQKNQCNKKTGQCKLGAIAEGQGCDDGNVCTVGEVCKTGTCVASADTCSCKTDADCKAQEDGDVCNGTLYCDKIAHQCVLNPATVVNCPKAQDTTCSKSLCAKKTGLCALAAVADGVQCDDGNTCTVSEVCTSGACVASADTCKCKSDNDCSKFEDGDACNGKLYCDKLSGQCSINPASVVVCSSAFDAACHKSQCIQATGVCEQVAVNSGGTCDADNNPCTANDFCSEGACKVGAMVCNCQLDKDCAGKQGANLCVGVMYCDQTIHECMPAKLVPCATGQDGPCQVTACEPSTGKCATKLRQDGEVCEANTLCTGVQICDKGACVTGKAVNCDDVNSCTADSCDAKQGGCLHVPMDATPCDDNSACTTQDTCAKGACVGNTLPCNDNEKCTNDSCDPKKGCLNLAVAVTACDDSDPCTVGDLCGGGKCVAGKEKLGCDDGVACTQDGCTVKSGCFNTPDSAACDDKNACLTDTCDPILGCKHSATTDPCSDGNACTAGDVCNGGTCVPGAAVKCDDGNTCTTDACNLASGCTHTDNVLACVQSGLCGVCSGGNCTKATALWQWSVGDSNRNDKFSALAAMPDGGFALAGSTDSESLGVPWGNWTEFWTRRTDALGKVIWDDVKGGDGLADDSAVALAVFPDGSIVSVGGVGGKLRVLCQNKAGVDLWNYSDMTWGDENGSFANWSVATAVLALPDGGVAVAGYVTTAADAKSKGFLVRLDANGSKLWAKTFASSSPTGQPTYRFVSALAAWPAGGFAIVGYITDAPKNYDPHGPLVVTYLSSNGAVLSEQIYDFDVPTGVSLQTLPDGNLLVAAGPKVGRLDTKGNMVWSHYVFAGNIRGVALLGGGRVALVGDQGDQGGLLGIRVIDALGNTAWESTSQWDYKYSFGNGILALPGGGLVIAGGYWAGKGAANGLLLRSDAFGNSTCKSAGVCLALSVSACDDTKPCTADFCDAVTGCTHNAVPSAYYCDPDAGPCFPENYCWKGECVSASTTCADGNPCTADSCDAKTGKCVFTNLDNGNTCTDGDPCTLSDGCVAGTCAGAPKICAANEKCQESLCVTSGPAGTATVMGGKFAMGCIPSDTNCDDDEKPQHLVDISTFFMDQVEVSVAKYSKCSSALACSKPDDGNSHWGCNWGLKGYEEHPVNCVTWAQASKYCQWMGGRLPTEAEWEKAARGGDANALYANGKNNLGCAGTTYTALGYYTCKNTSTVPVGSKPAAKSALGLYDMAGNVSEWVADLYDQSYYVGSPKVNPVNLAGTYRISRGGGYPHSGFYLRASDRISQLPLEPLVSLGFRCAYSAP